MKDLFNISELISLANKWKLPLMILALLSAFFSYIFSGPNFITPKYKSKVVIYPVNIIPYGNESPAEQTLQLLQSSDIRKEIIRKFDLMNHYEINKSNPKYPLTALIEIIDENISFRKTEFESIEINVLDANPDVAAAIVNTFVDLLNQKARILQRGKSAEVVVIYKTELEKKKKYMDSLESVLNKLSIQYNLVNIERQTQEVSRQYYQSISGKDTFRVPSELNQMMKNLKEKGGAYTSVADLLEKSRQAYTDVLLQYDNAVKDVEKELSYSNIISSGEPAEKPSYPVRWLIVGIATVSVLFFAFVFLAFYERLRTKNRFSEN